MVRCPKCGAENKDGAKCCAKCDHKLKNNSSGGVENKEAFLISVREGYEADMVEGCLRSAGIPFYKKGHGGPAGFARFDTKYESAGVDFYVPSQLLDKAIEALPPVEGAEELQKSLAEKEESSAASDKPQSKDRPPEPEENPVKRAVGIILFLIVMALVVFGVDAVMDFLRGLMGY